MEMEKAWREFAKSVAWISRKEREKGLKMNTTLENINAKSLLLAMERELEPLAFSTVIETARSIAEQGEQSDCGKTITDREVIDALKEIERAIVDKRVYTKGVRRYKALEKTSLYSTKRMLQVSNLIERLEIRQKRNGEK